MKFNKLRTSIKQDNFHKAKFFWRKIKITVLMPKTIILFSYKIRRISALKQHKISIRLHKNQRILFQVA